jgi:hypothetical protein
VVAPPNHSQRHVVDSPWRKQLLIAVPCALKWFVELWGYVGPTLADRAVSGCCVGAGELCEAVGAVVSLL